MTKVAFNRVLILAVLALIAFMLSACSGQLPVAQGSTGKPVFQVDSLFTNFYNEMGGETQLGLPTTGLLQEDGLQCQYTDLSRMCYDPYAAANNYRLEPIQASSQITSPFDEPIDRMGGRAVFGQPLFEASVTADGYLEQIFTTVIVYAPKDNPNLIAFRPLPKMLGMPSAAPGAQLFDRSQNIIFYSVAGNLGYHVPIFFDQFIAQHGGLEKSGLPISDAYMIEKGGRQIARQCFENYCLDYDPSAPEAIKTTLAPLGQQYAQGLDSVIIQQQPQVDNSLALQVSEDKSQLKSNDVQTFYLLVYRQHTMEPVANVTATVQLSLPDGAVLNYQSPATGANGWVSIQIPPMPDVENGTIVGYKICLDVPSDVPKCVSETYLIWNYN